MSAIKHLLLFLFGWFLGWGFFICLFIGFGLFFFNGGIQLYQLPVYFPFGKCGGSLGELGMLLFRVFAGSPGH